MGLSVTNLCCSCPSNESPITVGVLTAGDCGTDGVVAVVHGVVDADGVDADCGVVGVAVAVVGVVAVEIVGGVVSAGFVPDKYSLTFD